ncbi:MAG: septum formation initiator family protein [Deltaproteobacteria bacterium]|jgi:cell division protein FtsB|nr:septum formation initiator family protein [Deltaproteobacteria bacterium]
MSEPEVKSGILKPKGDRLKGFWGGLKSIGELLLGKFFRAGVIFAALCFIVYLLAMTDGFYHGGELQNRKITLEKENLYLEEDNRKLRAWIDRLGQDPAILEDVARRKLRLVKPGEVIYRLSAEPDLSDDEATARIQ